MPHAPLAENTLPPFIENHPFTEMQPGDGGSLVRRITERDIRLFAAVSGDLNPVHLDADYAQASPFHGVIAQGMLGAALISAVLGTRFPGPGTIYVGQSLRFLRPVRIGDELTATVTVKSLDAARHRAVLDTRCTNQDGVAVIEGEAEVLAPRDKQRVRRIDLPDPILADAPAGR